MQVFKKTVQRIMTTGETSGGVCFIPDTGATYYFKINLVQENKDLGFMDAYLEYYTNPPIANTPSISITGTSTSRLEELRKYAVNVPFNQQYKGNGSTSVDGVDFNNSIADNYVTYYIGGIRYYDKLTGSTSGTTFRFSPAGTNNPNFLKVSYLKNPNKENIVSNPKIKDDVFINRQELSAFEKNYRLEFVKGLVDLETYAGGKFFNIVNNT